MITFSMAKEWDKDLVFKDMVINGPTVPLGLHASSWPT